MLESHPSATRADAAAYIEDTCRELGDLARRSKLTMLAYLLDMARLEASSAGERSSRPPQAMPRRAAGQR